jgi:tetratricopeptide (TPR) repeat protein
MRLSRFSLFLTACAAAALAAPATAQDAPIIIDPSLIEPPVTSPILLDDAVEPNELMPPLVVPPEPATPAEPPAPPIPEIWAPVPVDAAGQSAYGLYLSGLLASLRGDYAEGSVLLAQSQSLVPEQPRVNFDTFRAGLMAGDVGAIVQASPAVEAQPALRNEPALLDVGRIAAVVEAMKRGDAQSGLAILQAGEFAVFERAARFLRAPVAAAANDWETALTPVTLTPDDPVSLILLHQHARLLETRRRYAEAEAAFETLLEVPVAAQLFARDYADFLKRRGRAAEALAYYERVLSAVSPDGSNTAVEARALTRKPPPPPPTPAELAAHGLRFAAISLRSDPNAASFVVIFLRLSTLLYTDDETALFLGETLAAGNQHADAREAFARVGPEVPGRYAEAQVGLGFSYARDERPAEALAAFERALAVSPGEPQIIRLLTAQLSGLGRHEEALAVIDDPSANAARARPEIREIRGLILQELDRIEEAEAELWAALQAAPDNPSLLNSLGYMWVDSGRRVDQGAEMLARAHAADPENGNIQDSLGWAQFRQGQYEIAVETLEGAVNKQPANPVIVDHLGDAYWQVGRRREAEWQWGRVLTLDPDAETRAAVEHKLAHGLSVEPSVSAGHF